METNTAECKVIDQIYNAAANPEGVNTLRAYQARGDRWHRLTEREADDTKAKRLRDRAELVRAKIEATQARAALVVIRRRMNRALTGFVPILLALLFVAGLLAFGLGADRLDSERTTRLAAYKACAEAFTAKVPATKLPALCNGIAPSTPATPTPDQARAAKIDALSTQYKSCVDTATDQAEAVAMCDGIKDRLAAAVSN